MKHAIARPRKLRPPPAPVADAIEWRGRRIAFTVVRSPRRKRTLSLRVVGERVEVRAPVRTPVSEVRGFVERKAEWVWDKLIGNRNRPAMPPFGHGESVPYLGRDAGIMVTRGAVSAMEVSLHDEDCTALVETPLFLYLGRYHFHVTAPAGMEGDELRDGVREALVAWYRARAAEVFRAAVAAWRPHVSPRAKPAVVISNARSQWGSCSSDGVLRFSWRCLMLGERQIDYIAVHELAHLKVRNHSKAFWRVVAQAMPDAAEVRRSVTRDSRGLPR